jgi:hypothetical protein
LSFIRRGWSDPSAAEKINDLQGLAGFGAKPFRLAKLTACRKVRGMYRPYRAKSSRYGHESAMPQAFLLDRA